MYLLGLASVFCILFIYKKLLLNCRLSTELSLLQQEEYSLNQYVEETKTRYEKTKSFRHDIKNHIAVVKKLLQSGKLEEAVSYIEDMDDMAEKCHFHAVQIIRSWISWWETSWELQKAWEST